MVMPPEDFYLTCSDEELDRHHRWFTWRYNNSDPDWELEFLLIDTENELKRRKKRQQAEEKAARGVLHKKRNEELLGEDGLAQLRAERAERAAIRKRNKKRTLDFLDWFEWRQQLNCDIKDIVDKEREANRKAGVEDFCSPLRKKLLQLEHNDFIANNNARRWEVAHRNNIFVMVGANPPHSVLGWHNNPNPTEETIKYYNYAFEFNGHLVTTITHEEKERYGSDFGWRVAAYLKALREANPNELTEMEREHLRTHYFGNREMSNPEKLLENPQWLEEDLQALHEIEKLDPKDFKPLFLEDIGLKSNDMIYRRHIDDTSIDLPSEYHKILKQYRDC